MNAYTSQLIIGFAALVSFLLTFASIPTILTVSYSKHLFAVPNNRNVHKTKIPTLGGLAIFISFIFTYSLFTDWFGIPAIPFLISSILIIFSIGIKDDILVTAPILKLLGQLISTLIIVGLGNLIITDFHGFFGLKPNFLTGFILSVFLILALVNGFNLIDGIDGLAGIIGIITISAFSVWFYINGNMEVPLIGGIVVGGLIAFLYFNIFTVKHKIFMGDTGSLILGFLIAVIAVRFMEFNSLKNNPNLAHTMTSAPAVVLGILIVPVVDTIRIFFLRISKGKSPFMADKNHIHHRLLSLGFTHIQTTLIIAGVNLFFIILSFSLSNWGTLRLGVLNLILGFAFAVIPAIFIHRRKKVIKIKARESASASSSGEQVAW